LASFAAARANGGYDKARTIKDQVIGLEAMADMDTAVANMTPAAYRKGGILQYR